MTLLSVHQQWFHMVLSKITISKALPSAWTSRLTKTLLSSHPHTLIVSQISLLTILGELSSWWLFNPPRSLQNSFTPHPSPLAVSFFGPWDFLPIIFFTQSKHSLSLWHSDAVFITILGVWSPGARGMDLSCAYTSYPLPLCITCLPFSPSTIFILILILILHPSPPTHSYSSRFWHISQILCRLLCCNNLPRLKLFLEMTYLRWSRDWLLRYIIRDSGNLQQFELRPAATACTLHWSNMVFWSLFRDENSLVLV